MTAPEISAYCAGLVLIIQAFRIFDGFASKKDTKDGFATISVSLTAHREETAKAIAENTRETRAVLAQAIKTNGRVTDLESWRGQHEEDTRDFIKDVRDWMLGQPLLPKSVEKLVKKRKR